jgi:hypothetical protein
MKSAFAISTLLLMLGTAPCLRSDSTPRHDRQFVQYKAPSSVPGGLPGVTMPPSVSVPQMPSLPATPPTLAIPPAAPTPPSLTVPPPAPPAARLPDAGGQDACDCRVEVDVPVYDNGQIVRWRREQRITGQNPQCCRK